MIQVTARDRDGLNDPENPAGQIEYSIVSTKKDFKIDAKTGWLSTNKVSSLLRIDTVDVHKSTS